MSISLPGISGYDFSSIIDSMVQAYKLPETQLTKQKTSLETQKSAWQDVNTRLSALDTTLAALQNASTWTATTATSSNTSYVTATGGTGALAGNYTVAVTKTAQAEAVVSKQIDDATLQGAMASASSWNFTINGTNVVIDNSTTPTLNDICSAINKAQAGVSASLIQVGTGTYRISITSNSTGATKSDGTSNSITFTDPNQTLYNLGICDGSGNPNTFDGTAGSGGISQQAQDAIFTVNGISISSASNTVKTAIQGVTLNLNASGSSTVSVTTDTSVAQKAVQSFVDQYNSVQSFISDKLSYDSTTKKAGDLLGDPVLQGIQSRLRDIVGSVVNSNSTNYSLLSQVGISTSSADYGKDASLTFDTDKFSTALAKDPQSVANLFGATYNNVSPTNTEGLYTRLHTNYLNPIVMYGGSIAQNQTDLTNHIKDVTDQISDFDDRVTAYQDMLKTKFSNLETLLSGLNSQSSALSSQLSALTSSSSSSK